MRLQKALLKLRKLGLLNQNTQISKSQDHKIEKQLGHPSETTFCNKHTDIENITMRQL